MSVAPDNRIRVVVIATYNERENIPSLSAAIIDLSPPFHVLFVDDNSPDGSAAAAAELGMKNPRVHLLRRPKRLGYGPAVLDGFRQALDLGAETVFTMDADHSHDPAELPRLAASLKSAEVVLGSRYLNGIRILNWSLGRLLLSLGANRYVRTVLRLGYSDCTSGFRGYRRAVVEDLLKRKFTSRGYAFLVEVLFALDREGRRIVELPIVYTERRVGRSKMSRAMIGEAALRPWLLLARRI